MKLAIHHRKDSFSEKWISYCKSNNIDYKIVNCYNNDIISQLNDCWGLMWHWAHWDSKAILFAKQLTYSLEYKGIKVFPNPKTVWHFDDKLGQKYLLEATNIQLVPSYVFYEKDIALDWSKQVSYPKVFKLRGGAGSRNVKLVHNRSSAKKLINKAFRYGFRVISHKNRIKDRLLIFKEKRCLNTFLHLLKGFAHIIFPRHDERNRSKDKGYIYFQDFIPNNSYDIRVIVIGNRAFAIKRFVRKNDFRASGSGKIIYNKKEIPLSCIEYAFLGAKKLHTQVVAFDFVFLKSIPFVVEISYGFSSKGYIDCPGYWDENLNWYEGSFTPEDFIIEDFLNSINE